MTTIETLTNHTPPPVGEGPTLVVDININADVKDVGLTEKFVLNPDSRADMHKALDMWLDNTPRWQPFAYFMIKVPG